MYTQYFILYGSVLVSVFLCQICSVYRINVSETIYFLQRHDIVKIRMDHLGNVIESKQDGIGAPKVYFLRYFAT